VRLDAREAERLRQHADHGLDLAPRVHLVEIGVEHAGAAETGVHALPEHAECAYRGRDAELPALQRVEFMDVLLKAIEHHAEEGLLRAIKVLAEDDLAVVLGVDPRLTEEVVERLLERDAILPGPAMQHG